MPGKDFRQSFDSSIADRFTSTKMNAEGLPGFLGCSFSEFSPGRLRAELKVRPELLTPFGNMHGGVMAALCDHVLGCVCYPHMKPGQWAATTEFKINYLAPVSQGTVAAEAEIVSMTRTTAVVRIEILNEDRIACIAQGTVLLRDPKS
jgi:1,4-dihydroxy-2-naphthoyl-CoA hydrolase